MDSRSTVSLNEWSLWRMIRLALKTTVLLTALAVRAVFGQWGDFSHRLDRDNITSLVLDALPGDFRQVLAWADEERLLGDSASAARLYRFAALAAEDDLRDWAAFWLAALDSTLWRKLPRKSFWGRFFGAVATADSAPWEALQRLTQLQRENIPESVKLFAAYWRGLIFERTRWVDSAAALWTDLVESHPKSFIAGEVFFRLGALHLSRGEYDTAAALLAKALKLHQTSAHKESDWWADEAAFLRAVSFVRADDIASAESCAALLERNFPESGYVDRIRLLLAAYSGSTSVEELPSEFRADLLLRRGWDYMDSHKYKAALATFLQAHAAFSSEEALVFAAECAYRLGRYDLADSLYSTVSGDYVPYALWGRGWCLVRLGQYDSARAVWSKLVSNADFADDASYAIAKSFYLQRRLDDAVREIGDYLSRFDKHAKEMLGLLFFARLEAGDTALALEDAAKYVRRYPTGHLSALVALAAARAMEARGHYGALVAWADSLEKNYKGALGDSLALLAERAKFHLGEYTERLDILGGFIRRRPKSELAVQLALGMGRDLESARNWQDAIYAYSRAQTLSLPGDSAWCEATLGILRAQLTIGDTAAAMQTLHDLEIDGEPPWTAIGKMFVARWMWRYIGDYEKTLGLFSEVARRFDGTELGDSALLGMSEVYISSQMFAEAKALLQRRWRTMDKKSALAMDFAERLFDATWELGLQDSAVDFALNFADSVADPCGLVVHAGWSTLTQGRPELAGRIKEKLDSLGCEDLPPQFLLQMGDAMVQLERIPDACSLFALVAKTHPNDSLGEIARERLKAFRNAGAK